VAGRQIHKASRDRELPAPRGLPQKSCNPFDKLLAFLGILYEIEQQRYRHQNHEPIAHGNLPQVTHAVLYLNPAPTRCGNAVRYFLTLLSGSCSNDGRGGNAPSSLNAVAPEPQFCVVLPLLAVGIALVPKSIAVLTVEGKQVGSPKCSHGSYHKADEGFHFWPENYTHDHRGLYALIRLCSARLAVSVARRSAFGSGVPRSIPDGQRVIGRRNAPPQRSSLPTRARPSRS